MNQRNSNSIIYAPPYSSIVNSMWRMPISKIKNKNAVQLWSKSKIGQTRAHFLCSWCVLLPWLRIITYKIYNMKKAQKQRSPQPTSALITRTAF